MRTEIEAILASRGINYKHITRGRRPAYQFSVNGKTLYYTYGNGGDTRAHLNARTQLRSVLRSAGISDIEDIAENPMPPAVTAATANAVSDAFVEAVVERDDHESVMNDSELLAEDERVPPTPVVAPMATPNRTYQSAKVLGIKLERDLLVSAGNMLVIPLNRPTTVMEMTEDQFCLLFSEVAEEAAAPPPPPAALWPESPRQKRVYNRREQSSTATRPVLKEAPHAIGRIAGPIPPQIGRMLLAMTHTRRVTGKEDLSLQMVGKYLDERDFRQYSARMPNAIKLGLVEQGLPSPTGRGYLYKLTQKAYDLLKEIKGWPYEVDEMPTPPWLLHLF
jgi:hypothetical protein